MPYDASQLPYGQHTVTAVVTYGTTGTLTSTATFLTTNRLLETGLFHSCAVVNGGVKCWGGNSHGQVGNPNLLDALTPYDVIAAGSGAKSVSTGNAHTCALVGNGVKCWGINTHGELGVDPVATPYSATPVSVPGLVSNVTAVDAGVTSSCAIQVGGILKCWGGNYFGQIGNGTTGTSVLPAYQTIASGVDMVSVGEAFACAVKSGGAAWCWGNNVTGQLGDGTTTVSLSPKGVPALTSNVTGISASESTSGTGDGFACAIQDHAMVKCWGDNQWGQLGYGDTNQRLAPSAAITGLSTPQSVVANGKYTACSQSTSGGLKCWGYNNWGQVGNGSATVNFTTPQQVLSGAAPSMTTGVTFSSVNAWNASAISGGHFFVWGYNPYGQLGNNTTNSIANPLPVAVCATANCTSFL
jgi:alpha-tubulin suppressor-like RCC1 family protein